MPPTVGSFQSGVNNNLLAKMRIYWPILRIFLRFALRQCVSWQARVIQRQHLRRDEGRIVPIRDSHHAQRPDDNGQGIHTHKLFLH